MSVTPFSYLIDSKEPLTDARKKQGWDLFLSAYNDNERVQKPFAGVAALRKCWWSLPEYNYHANELPDTNLVEVAGQANEADFVREGLSNSGFSASSTQSICIDITGFMRPHILYFLKYLKDAGVKQIDMIYTEPEHYARKAETTFSIDDVVRVRSVFGFEGQHGPGMEHDALVVGVGYDHGLPTMALPPSPTATFCTVMAGSPWLR